MLVVILRVRVYVGSNMYVYVCMLVVILRVRVYVSSNITCTRVCW